MSFQLWNEYCPECEKQTKFRWLSCSECKDKGEICPMAICTQCDYGYNKEYKYTSW